MVIQRNATLRAVKMTNVLFVINTIIRNYEYDIWKTDIRLNNIGITDISR